MLEAGAALVDDAAGAGAGSLVPEVLLVAEAAGGVAAAGVVTGVEKFEIVAGALTGVGAGDVLAAVLELVLVAGFWFPKRPPRIDWMGLLLMLEKDRGMMSYPKFSLQGICPSSLGNSSRRDRER